ncbi:J domain-containing protein [Gymnodinialimonas ulvae]|uniref:J domain-containing protein n=1 Tax=Gymnodinialimonas ulvae TaxID=3126504 RepID=UPI00309BBA47
MNSDLQRAFKTLGVPADAPLSDVRAAYRTLIRTHHPDHATDDGAAATQRLAEINAAKDLIDRGVVPTPVRPRRPKQTQPRGAQPKAQSQSQSQQQPQQQTGTKTASAEELRQQREAQARAYRKANEARCDVDDSAQSYVRRAAAAEQAQVDPAQQAREDARRERQAAFAAALNGQASGGSFLGRLRSLGSR